MPQNCLLLRAGVVLGATLAVFVSRPAHAADPADLPPSGGSSQPVTSGLEPVVGTPYWARGLARPFLATVVELGLIYFRPLIALGYGKPHWSWVGVEYYPAVSSSGGAQYAGVHAALPFLELRAGARYFFAANRSFLRPQESYERVDIERLVEPRSRYVALEAELQTAVPMPIGDLFFLATGYAVDGVPDGYYLYEESLHAVMKPPYIGRMRLGYVLRFGPKDAVAAGVLAEGVALFGREEAVVRTGPVVRVTMTPYLEALATLAFVVSSPDTLGLVGADAGQFGIRYRWATGTRAHHMTW